MSTPFIKKYSPQYLKDFQFDDYFIDAIKNLLSLNLLNLLFIGNVGTGKTSIIRALINEYYRPLHNNTVDSKFCESKIAENVLYINNLSEQGISYYRTEVKTFCQIQCSIPNKKKILVLDDLDMVSIQSQQVFRNCIDTYGSNIHCIASCTNTQKVINSIQSRTTIIRLYPVSFDGQIKIANHICQHENIEITDEMINSIAKITDGSISLLINYLEKYKLLHSSTHQQTIVNISSATSYFIFDKYMKLCQQEKICDAINILYTLIDKGYSVIDILDSFFYYIKQNSLISEGEKHSIICYISNYITIFYNIHEDEIELAIFTKNIIDIFK